MLGPVVFSKLFFFICVKLLKHIELRLNKTSCKHDLEQLALRAYSYCYSVLSGLNKVHAITEAGNCKLRIELVDWDDDSAWAEYRLLALNLIFFFFYNLWTHYFSFALSYCNIQ